MERLFLPLNLQFFSEEPPAEPNEPTPQEPQEPTKPQKVEFTAEQQAHIEKMLKERLERDRKKREDEAEKQRLLESNEFKALYEAEKSAREKVEQERAAEKLQQSKLTQLIEAGYTSDKIADLIELVIGEDEDSVKASIERLIKVAPPKPTPVDPTPSGGSRQQPSQETLKEKGRKRFDELRAKGLI